MRVGTLDHLVLTVADVARSVAFYTTALGMTEVRFDAGRVALAFGTQRINLHPQAAPFTPHALHPAPGSADLCFVADGPIAAVVEHLGAVGVLIELGPVPRTGARGAMISVYLRDPDGNLVEIASYDG